MGRIDLGRERGVSPTDKPLPRTVVNDNTGLAGIYSIEKANDRLAAGMRHISDSMFEISKDMKNSEVRLETVNAQIEYFDRSQAALRELSERNIHDQTEYENAFNAAMDKVDAHMAKWAKDNTSWGESRDALGLMEKDGRAKNFASAMGQFLDARKKRKAQTLQNNYDRLVDSGDLSNVEVLLENSGLAPETKKIYLEKAARKIAENEAKSIAEISNDADRQREIELHVGLFAKAAESGAGVLGSEFLSEKDIQNLHSMYLEMSKKNESLIEKRHKESTRKRIAAIEESEGKERALRIEAFEKFLGGCKYINAQDRVEARETLNKFLSAESAKKKKAKSDAIKLQNLNFKSRTKELFADGAVANDDELANMERIRNAAKSAFSAPNMDGNGKITASTAEKQQFYIAKLQDAIDSYDSDADETGVYGRALLYQLEAVFTDIKPESDASFDGTIYAPQEARRLRRELGERLGIFAKANIKVENVKEYVAPIFEDALGGKFSSLNAAQRRIYTQLKQAFVRTAMTAGLNDERELGQWVSKSPYVATLREKLKLLKGQKKPDGFDSDFAYIENQTAKAPNLAAYSLGDIGISSMEAAYLKMKNKRDEKLLKEEK